MAELSTDPIARVIVQPIVLAGPAADPDARRVLRARRVEIEAL